MPKKVINDYIFYKIICLDNSVELCYVGSTANWKERQRNHRSKCNNENNKLYNSNIYKTIRDNGGWCNFKMIEISKKEQLNKRQAEQIEEEYRVELKANMNSKKCYLTEEQQQNYHQNYREENVDKLLKQQQNYRDKNKNKVKARLQKWCEENKNKLLKYQQKYREANRDKVNERQIKYNEKALEKVKCDCGCMVSKLNLPKHQKTKKHINLMKIKTENENI